VKSPRTHLTSETLPEARGSIDPGERGGLTAAEVAEARDRYGWNELPRDRIAWPSVLFRQFTGLLVLILIGAAVIAYAVGEVIDAIAIAFVVLLNGVLGFVQEWRAERALEALQGMLAPQALVVRDGEERMISAREIVPGDLLVFNPGDVVAADTMLFHAVEIRVDESILTGESFPVEKAAGADGPAGQVLTGSSVVAGRAEGHVTAIGSETRMGRIADLTRNVDDTHTPLQRQLGRLARQLGLAAIGIAGAVFVLGLAVERPVVEMFMTGLSLAVAIVPEGLPAVVTITLALGATAMARHKALVRRLQAIETLGAASVVCTDKTGTLTENQMTATDVWTEDKRFAVTGSGYDPAGHIAVDDQRVRADDDPVLCALLRAALSCNHATLSRRGDEWTMTGDPTEGALVTLAYKGWMPQPELRDRILEKPFSSERKMMSVLVRNGDECRQDAKGAPEVILDRSAAILTGQGPRPLTKDERARVTGIYKDMASRGLRVIALAERSADPDEPVEDGFTLIGLVGMLDPPRPEVQAAIAQARGAGISVIMITGDGPETAAAVARALGMDPARCLTGADLDALSDVDLARILSTDVLFARTMPEHKMRIVEALQDKGAIVAMTGDGVNDAPALKRADIGIAMGIRGTEVAKGASDLVILDDNFATIVRAIAEGRQQFSNICKFVRYLLASNAGEVLAIVANLLIGGPLIFLATQILWMNLVTDGITAVALGMERSEARQMQRPPRRMDERIVGRSGLLLILAFGTYTALASLWLFYSFLPMGVDIARTAAFTGMIVFEKVSVFAFRSLTQPCWKIGWASNRFLLAALAATFALQVAAVYSPPLQILLHTAPLAATHWLLIAALALPLIVVPELVKSVRSRTEVMA